RARRRDTGELAAIKLLLYGHLALPAERERFAREARAAALDHPNVVPVLEVGETEGQPFLVMPLVEGVSLAASLARGDWADVDAEKQRTAARLVSLLARAMHHAHLAGVIHRDLKPANILLSGEWRVASGEQEKKTPPAHAGGSPLGSPMIADFGLAKL